MQRISVRRLVRAIMVTAVAATGLVAVGAPPGSAAPCQQTFTNNVAAPISPFLFPMPFPSPPLPMPPSSGTSTLEVADGTIVDVDVTVNITHATADQLTVVVQHGVTPVVLKNPGVALGANFTGTTFDDEATQSIGTAAPPYSGRFTPSSPLSAYDGTAAGGTWTLSASIPTISVGSIDSWSVTVTYVGTCAAGPGADTDADGVPAAADSCPSLAGHTASGCPLASNAVIAKYRHRAFKGALSSTVPACRAGKSVSIWKVRKGPDRLVGTKTTASDGTYRLKRARHAGRYYATSPRMVLGNVAECPAVQSPTFRLR